MGKSVFKALTPENITEKDTPYTEALDFALDKNKKNITNIAVTWCNPPIFNII